MADKLKFAVVGCGRIGSRRVQTILDNPDAELVCVADTEDGIAKAMGEKAGCKYYLDYCEAISHPDVNCVVIATPNKSHAPASIAASKNGKHVFCEKPLARNTEEATSMVKAALENDVSLTVSSNLRYFPSMRKAKELLNDSAIGETLFLRGWIGHARQQLKIPAWFSDIEVTGGGVLLDNGYHLLDISRWFLGEVEGCIGRISTTYWPIAPQEDNGFGIFEFENGKTALIQASWIEWVGYMYMEVYGTEGYIQIDNRNPSCKTVHGDKDGSETIYDYSQQPPVSFALEFNNYIKTILSHQQPLPSGFDGLRVLQMIYGVYESSRLGQKVRLWGNMEKKLAQSFKRKV